MSVYVDRLQTQVPQNSQAKRAGEWWSQQWCHMWADSEAELMHMAREIGLKEKWIQRSRKGLLHFDLVPSKRYQAIDKGAIEGSLKRWYWQRFHGNTEKEGLSKKG